MYPIYCLGCIKIVNLQGRLKSSRKLSSELTFDFQIESIGKLVFVISVEYLIKLFTITTQNYLITVKSSVCKTLSHAHLELEGSVKGSACCITFFSGSNNSEVFPDETE